MGLGFREAAKAGISFGKDDIVIPAAQDSRSSTRPASWWKSTSSSTPTA